MIVDLKEHPPAIVGYFDLDLNCLYSAIVDKDKTIIKYMVVSKDPEFFKQRMIRIVMTYTGYVMHPVFVKDPMFTDFEKLSPINQVQLKHWSVGWFKADYMRWSTLKHHDPKEVKKVIKKGTKPASGMYNRPTTRFISTISLSELVAAHVSYAHCVDCESNDKKFTLSQLLDAYIEETNLRSRHSNNIRNMVAKTISGLNIGRILQKNKDPNFTIGVDTFVKFK